MKKITLRALSAALIFALVMPFTACNLPGQGGGNGQAGTGASAENHSGQKIAEDSTWFDSKINVVDLGFDLKKKVVNCRSSISDSDDKRLLVLTTGRYQMTEENKKPENMDDAVICSLSLIDRKTLTTEKTIDLSGSITMFDTITEATLNNGKVKLNIAKYDSKTFKMTTVEQEVDIETGKLQEAQNADKSGDQNVAKTYTIEGRKVRVIGDWSNGRGAFVLEVGQPDGSIKKAEIKDNTTNFFEIATVLNLNEGHALVCINADKGDLFYDLDLNTAEIKTCDSKEYEWLDLENLRRSFSAPDGKSYYTTYSGVSCIDMKNKSSYEVMNYSSCGVNRTYLSQLDIFDCSENSILLCGQKMDSTAAIRDNVVYDFCIVSLTKAEKNPHAGKTILNLYVNGGQMNDTVADSIIKFNDTNSGYYIEVTDKYTKKIRTEALRVNSNDEYNKVYLDNDNKMGNELAVDLINGNGPDIMLDISQFRQLNSSSYLVDLAPYFQDMSSDKYFTNLIEASKTGGKLYQMPVCFVLEGICTDSKYAGKSGVGFTTDEYEKFIKQTMNGEDLIDAGQAMYFAKVFSAMSDKFIKEGKADFSGPEFAALAEFVKNNIPEKSISWNNNVSTPVSKVATFTSSYGLSGFFYNIANINGDAVILGIPSADGRGPLFEAYSSVAVSAQTKNVDACVEFVKILLSDEIQEKLANEEHLVINRQALRTSGLKAIEHYNLSSIGMGTYAAVDPSQENSRYKYSEKDLDKLEKTILSCSGMKTQDTAISIILIEEMPPYFLGQKDLASVIKIAQDRAQKVLDERK